MRKLNTKLGASATKLKQVVEHKLPVAAEAVKDVLKLIKACSTEELALLGLQPPPLPSLGPVLSYNSDMPLASQLQAVQNVISAVHYNHMPGYYFNVSKARPLPAILATAAAILRDPLPIKCIEAVFLGMLLTQGWGQGQLQRIPMGFKSVGADSQVYRHIVLAILDPVSGVAGALGISRRHNLMYKPPTFHSLAELVADYRAAYSGWGHQLVKVRVGLPIEYDKSYAGPVCWRYCTVNPEKRSWASVTAILNQHAADTERLQAKFRAAVAPTSNIGIAGGCSSSVSSPTPLAPQPHITRPHHLCTSASGCVSNRADVPGLPGQLETGYVIAPALPTAPLTPRLRSQTRTSSIVRSSCPAVVSTQLIPGKAAASSSSVSCGGCNSSSIKSLVNSAAGADSNARVQHQQQHNQQQEQARFGATCDSSSEENAEFDSDSEVNALVVSIRHSPRREHA